MNAMTIGETIAIMVCGVVAAVILIVGIVLLVDQIERCKCWLKKRKMKTYMVQFNTNKSYRDNEVCFYNYGIECAYYKARNPQMAIKKLFDETRFSLLPCGTAGVLILKVEEIQPK